MASWTRMSHRESHHAARELHSLREQLARYASRDTEQENTRLREQIRALEAKQGDRQSDLEDENRALRQYVDSLINKLLDANMDGFLEVAKTTASK